MGTLRRQQDLVLQLLLDQELRERFFDDREAVIDELDLDTDDVEFFSTLDQFGLEVDARLRRDYLMSALCRPYPVTAASIGSSAKGRRALVAFLASPKLRGELHIRTAAFGDHLARLLKYQAIDLPAEVSRMLEPVLALERARVDNAAAIRALVAKEGASAAPRVPTAVTPAALKRGKVVLPPFFLLAELHLPLGILVAALDQVGPHNAWSLIRAGALNVGRLTTVARALPMPVTVLSRGLARGLVSERAGSGGLSPLFDVSHLVAEVSGRQAKVLSTIDGRLAVADLPVALARLVVPLAEQGLLQML